MFNTMLKLRSEMVTDRGELVSVQLPLSPELWEHDGELFREQMWARARAELRHAVASRGHVPAAGHTFDDAPVWVEYPDKCTVECVGGPLDGARVPWTGNEPPPMLRLLAPHDATASLLHEDLDASLHEPLPIVTYGPMTNEHGFFARAADGAWRYAFRR
ncbi:hypothetical protein [Streptomyces sp. NPDC001536]|uniref:hypothetical protein n=1 Tax=Streptomyces sp. NPDC001536 TaxID=3364583 RepID=UPI00369D9D2C